MPAEIATDQEPPAAAALRWLTEELPWLPGIADTVLGDCWKLWLPRWTPPTLSPAWPADDARRVAAQCAWNFVLYGQLGATSVAMMNRAEAATSC